MPGVYLNPLQFPDDWNAVVFAGTLRTPGKCKVGKWERKVEYDHKAGKGTKGALQTLKGLPPAQGDIEFWAWIPDHFDAWTEILALLHFDPTKGGSATKPGASTATATAATSVVGTSGTTNAGSGTVSGATLPTGSTAGIPGTTATGLSAFTGNEPNKTTSNTQPALSSAYAIDIFHPAIADLDVAYVLPPDEIGSWEEDGEGSGMYKRTIKFHEYTGAPPNVSAAATPTGAAAANTATPPGTAQSVGGSVPAAATAASGGAAAAAKDAQGAWGAP